MIIRDAGEEYKNSGEVQKQCVIIACYLCVCQTDKISNKEAVLYSVMLIQWFKMSSVYHVLISN